MKFYVLRAWARCRRLFGRARHAGAGQRETRDLRQIEKLMRRASPFASWTERAHWMVDVAAWLRAEPPVWSVRSSGLICGHQRTRLLLDWLQKNREVRRVVQTALQKTLREAIGPELFCGAGLPRRSNIFGELVRRAGRMLLPAPLVPGNLSALLLASFPEERDERWLRSLDPVLRRRLWKLIGDEGIGHALTQQIDEALHSLVNAVVATGISDEVRQRSGPRVPLRATPFMALRRELEKFLAMPFTDDAAMRSVRMLLAVCQAQTDKVYQHLDEHGVSVSLVIEIEQMRARLTRMARLIDLRVAVSEGNAGQAMQVFLADSVRDHHRSKAGSMIGRSFTLLARKIVERNSSRQEHQVARDRRQYSDVLRAGCAGGAVLALTVLGMLALDRFEMAGFVEMVAYSGLFGISLLSIGIVGGTLAARQSPVVAPMLAARMGLLDTVEGLRGLLKDSAALIRAQVAATFGNLIVVIPLMLVIGIAAAVSGKFSWLQPEQADGIVRSLSVLGMTPLLAIVTGLLCWFASLAAGLADNWFVLHRLRDAVAYHAGLRMLFGPARALRFADWFAQLVPAVAGGVALALFFGMLPAIGGFFGLPLDVRHGVLSAGLLAAAGSVEGIAFWQQSSSWLAIAGVAVSLVLNVATPFLCSLLLALHARGVQGRARRMVMRSLLRRLRSAPSSFLLPPGPHVAATPTREGSRPVVPLQPDTVEDDRTGTD